MTVKKLSRLAEVRGLMAVFTHSIVCGASMKFRMNQMTVLVLSAMAIVLAGLAVALDGVPLGSPPNTDPYKIEGPGLGNLDYTNDPTVEVLRGGIAWVTTSPTGDNTNYPASGTFDFNGNGVGDVPDNSEFIKTNTFARIQKYNLITGASKNETVDKKMKQHYGTNVGAMVNGYFVTVFAPDSGEPGGGFLVYDISKPKSIRLVKKIYDVKRDPVSGRMSGETSEFREPHALGTAIVNGRRFMAVPTVSGVEFWDFTSINNIKRASKLAIPGVEGGDYDNVNWQMAWQSPYLYIAGANNGIYVIDASDPVNPKVHKRSDGSVLRIFPGIVPGPIFVHGNQLVVTGMNNKETWVSLDISDPLNPVPLAAQAYNLNNSYYASCFDGLNIYPATRFGKAVMNGYSLEDPAAFKELPGKIVVDDSLYCATQDNFVFQGAQLKVHKINVSNPSLMTEDAVGSKNPTFNVSYSREGSTAKDFTAASVADVQRWANSKLLHPQALVGKSSTGTYTLTVNDILAIKPGTAEAYANHDSESYRLSSADHGQITPLGNLIYVGEDHGGGSAFMVHQKAKDLTPPSVRSVSPRNGALNQAVTSRIGIALSDMIMLESVKSTTFKVVRADTRVQVEGDYTAQLGFINFTPKQRLAPGVKYEIELTQFGVKDYAGNGVAQTFKSSFTTAATSATAKDLQYNWKFVNGLNEDIIGLNAALQTGSTAKFDAQGILQFGPTATTRGVTIPSALPEAISQNKQLPQNLLTGSVTFSYYIKTTQTGSDYAWQAPGIYGADQRDGINDAFWGFINSQGKLVFQIGNAERLVTNTRVVTNPDKTTATTTTTSREALKYTGLGYSINRNNGREYNMSGNKPIIDGGAIVSTEIINDGKWHHVVLTRNNDTGQIAMYIDGGKSAPDGSVRAQTLNPPQVGFSGILQMPKTLGAIEGNTRNGSPVFFQGSLGDVRIYDKVFTEKDAYALYSSGFINTADVTIQGNANELTKFDPTWIVGASGTTYSWNFGDGSAPTAFSTDPKAQYRFLNPGRYNVSLTRQDATGALSLPQSFNVSIVAPPTAKAPSSTTNITGNGFQVFSLDPDSGTVSAIDSRTMIKQWEVKVGKEPRTLALAGPDKLWVTVQGDDKIVVLATTDGAVLASHQLDYGSGPHGIVFNADKNIGLISLESKSTVLSFNPNNSTPLANAARIAVPGMPRGIAIDSTGMVAYVTKFMSNNAGGSVYKLRLDANTRANNIFESEIKLDVDVTTLKSEDSSPGIPNYLHQIVISPDGKRAVLPSKKDNSNDPLQGPENTVRSVANFIDLGLGKEVLADQMDFNNSAIARAAAYSPRGDYIFVAQMEGNTIAVMDALKTKTARLLAKGGADEAAPHGLYLDTVTNRLFVNNFLGRTVSVYDVSDIIVKGGLTVLKVATIKTVANEPLAADVLAGKKVFYNAADGRMSLNSYISCASCHADGGQDGMTWDFTNRGQGKRSNISLQGRSGTGHGKVHWTGNFDEIQDFENDIRQFFGGSGFMSADQFSASENPLSPNKKAGRSVELDQLAAYVTSLSTLPRSPNRNADGSFSNSALLGKKVFDQLNCASCHSGATRQDGALKTLASNGSKTLAPSAADLGAKLGIDTPTLEGIWQTAPYFHDGRANSLKEVFTTYAHGLTSTTALSATDTDSLVAYLSALDGTEENNWPLLNNALDTKRGNHGPASFEATPFTTGATTADGAIDLSQLPNGLLLNNDTTGKILSGTSSLSFSVKTTQVGKNQRWLAPGIFGYEDYRGGNDIFWGYLDIWGNLVFAVGDDNWVRTSERINTGAWEHIVMTRDAASGRIAIYRNGVKQSEIVSKKGAIEKLFAKTIGWFEAIADASFNVTPTRPDKFNGSLKDVRVFGAELKPSEVQALYESRLK